MSSVIVEKFLVVKRFCHEARMELRLRTVYRLLADIRRTGEPTMARGAYAHLSNAIFHCGKSIQGVMYGDGVPEDASDSRACAVENQSRDEGATLH